MAHKNVARILKEQKVMLIMCEPFAWSMLMKKRKIIIMFNIDGLLLARALSHVVTNYGKKLDANHGTNYLLAVTRGETNRHLGNTL